MALMTRFSRLLRADAHAILDQLEEPEVLLKQAVRDMEEELTANEERMRREEAQLEHLDYQATEVRNLIKRFDEEIQVCFAAEKEALAKNFIRRKLESEQFLDQITNKVERKTSELEALKQQHQDQKADYESIRQKSELLWQDYQMKRGRFQEIKNHDGAVLEDDVEIAFIKEKQRYNTV